MPRATDLQVRLALARMVRHGASASDIALHLDLPLSTARGLIRRVVQAGPDPGPADLAPRYRACGPRPAAPSPFLEPALALRREHPRWGAARIRVELARRRRDARPPSVRTLQCWL